MKPNDSPSIGGTSAHLQLSIRGQLAPNNALTYEGLIAAAEQAERENKLTLSVDLLGAAKRVKERQEMQQCSEGGAA